MRRLVFAAVAVLGCCSGAFAADLPAAVPPATDPVIVKAPPEESGRFTLIEENDAFVYPNPTDWWYTQGLQLNYLSAPIAWNGAAAFLPSSYLDPGSFRTQRFEFVFGQNIFTPMNVTLNPPDPRDRPYAGWLYVGAGLYQETDRHSLDHVQLLVGVVGPDALAEEIQNGFHRLIGGLVGQLYAAGWNYQLGNEPGIMLSYEHKWRWDMPLGGGFAVDVIPDVGVTVGNVFTYAETGGIIRFGQNLNVDYGPARIKPALSGTTWFDPSQLQGPLGWYFFAGAAGRAVAQNVFLDGVEKVPLVADFTGGLSFFWSDRTKLDFVVTWRTKEFVGQPDYDRFGGINFSCKLP